MQPVPTPRSTDPFPARAFGVLVVDDDPSICRALERTLLRAGYRVAVASSCASALACPSSFETAVLDLELPDGEGTELAWRLLEGGRVTQVVFFTGAGPALRRRASRFGAIVGKGEDTTRLLAALSAWRGRAPRR